MKQEQTRFLLSSDTPGHTAGYHVVARGLQDAGMEVISLGHAEPAEVADAALQEDVDFVGYRITDRDPVALVAALRSAMKERGISHIPIIVGGVVLKEAVPALEELGVLGVFGPGSRIPDIAEFVYAHRAPEDPEGLP
ncbi:MAG: cobalamin-dependent protein [Dehalococcoidia bacterium]|jgi:methylmalonyl-CoA mutase cobalamin-binding domain/chain|nr:cobalamin-dependent protein [Dehalococcoidia bacterium]MDP6227993.1 cobalamin-dependent protein [Dehalococcoidia bacterium]MDP7084487.1 cobalamin-dependent protein [Dehalococcoidia bacterium]MDP7200659.1 cobalamin-dependent protein [Dehalococcoidia bacterium]MDP7510810.1 cobalamin-dependent protein [Dehalococcoidia bacterium]